MPDTVVRMPELGARRSWAGLGNHGFVYMDSLGDTGATHVPRHSRVLGSTGTWGDPRWETLDLGETFYIFAIGVGAVGAIMTGLLEKDLDRWQDVVVITPAREKLRRPHLELARAPPHVALEDVLAELRARAGLPVGDLAAMLGVSRRQFYNWIGRENEPDLEQEQRVRHTAALVDELYAQYGEGRLVRAALLAETVHGSAFDAFKVGDVTVAEQAIEATMVSGAPRDAAAPSQRLRYDRERVLTELQHLRDTPLRGDG